METLLPSPATLSDLLQRYFLERETGADYQKGVYVVASWFESFLERQATIADFTPETVNRWLIWLGEQPGARNSTGRLSRTTLRNYRRVLLTLWRFAFEANLTDVAPLRVRKIKAEVRSPVAWTVEECRRLLDAAEKESGRWRRSRLKKAAYWRAFILVGWDSGLRFGDLLRLRTDDVQGKSSFDVLQHKTKREIHVRLSPAAREAVEATYPPARDYVFATAVGKSRIYREFRALCEKAGVPLPHLAVTKMLRRSGATSCESKKRGGAASHLGHLDGGEMATRHYIDQRLVGESKIGPVPLVGEPEPDPSTPVQGGPQAATAADLEGLLRRVLTETQASHAAGAEPNQPVPAMYGLMAEFLDLPEIEATSSAYQNGLRSCIREMIEQCEFNDVDDVKGGHIVRWLRSKRLAGASAYTVSWQRCAVLRFLRWAVASGAGGGLPGALGKLTAASDLYCPTGRSDRAQRKVEKRRARRAELRQQRKEGGERA